MHILLSTCLMMFCGTTLVAGSISIENVKIIPRDEFSDGRPAMASRISAKAERERIWYEIQVEYSNSPSKNSEAGVQIVFHAYAFD